MPSTRLLLSVIALAASTAVAVTCGRGTYKTGTICNYCPPGTYNDRMLSLRYTHDQADRTLF